MSISKGRKLYSIDHRLTSASIGFRTPFLVIDLAAAQRNIEKMVQLVGGTEISLRPHYKAHKSPRLMTLQLAAPFTVGATCQTVSEAVLLARMGCRDVLLTNQLVNARDAEALASVPHGVAVSVLIDGPEQVKVIGHAAAAGRRNVAAYIECDVGLGRGGFSDFDVRARATVREIEAHEFLTVAGVQAYEGHAVLIPDRKHREDVAADAYAKAAAFRRTVAEFVGRHIILTGGGTGTADMVVRGGYLDEIQCGSYVLMDAAYSQLDLPFEAALYCVASVLSTHPDGRVLLNAGTKSMSADGLPRAYRQALAVLGMSDEHVRASQSSPTLSPGDRVLLQPWHVDPTMNLHRDVVLVGDNMEAEVSPLRGHHSLLR